MKNQQKPKHPGKGAERALCNCPDCIRKWREISQAVKSA